METHLRYWQVIEEKFKNDPSIRAGDATAFRQFYNFILKCDSVISLQNWNALDSPETLSVMISKFPRHIRYKWNRKVLSLRKKAPK